MANSRELQALTVIAVLTLLVGSVGVYLGFRDRSAFPGAAPVPKVPDQGPILYEMRSVRSDPDRVRFEWRAIDRAASYRVTVMTAEDESLFVSPELSTNYWTLPPPDRSRLQSQSVYHWRVSARLTDDSVQSSEPAAFATQ